MNDRKLAELLERWEQSREEGTQLSAGDLVPDDPALRDRLAEQISRLLRLDQYLDVKPQAAALLATPARIGSYEVLERIAHGGMGIVYRCRQESPSRHVAVKLIHPFRVTDEALKRFRLEAEILGMLQHANIATIYEAGVAHAGGEEVPYIAMELIDGEPLDRYVTSKRLSSREIVRLMIKICRALRHAHEQGIIHRDLKPANILVDRNGQPHVVDFGVARLIAGEHASFDQQTGSSVLGSLGYMSPEQLQYPLQQVDARSDVYALGVILYKLLLDQFPYDVQDRGLFAQLEEIVHAPPPRLGRSDQRLRGDLEAILAMAMERQPAARYQSVAAFADDLQRYLDAKGVSARPLSLSARLWRTCRRHPTVSILATTTVLAVLAGFCASIYLGLSAASALKEAHSAGQLAAENHRAAVEKEQQVRELAALTKFQAELVQRSAYNQRLLRASRLLESDPVLALQWLEDEDACPVEWRGFAWHYLHQCCTREELSLSAAYTPSALAFSPDGSLLAALCQDQLLRVWNARTGELLCQRVAVRGAPTTIAFARDGEHLICPVERGKLRVLTSDSFEEVHRMRAHDGEVVALAMSCDGRWLASAGADRKVKLWDTATWTEAVTLPEYETPVSAIAFTPDCSHLVTMRANRETTWWDLKSREIDRVHPGNPPSARWIAISPNLQFVAASNGKIGRETNVFDPSSGSLLKCYRQSTRGFQAYQFSPDSQLLARAGAAGSVEVWNLETDREEIRFVGHEQPVTCLVFSPEGSLLASASEDRTIKLWQLRSAEAKGVHQMDAPVRQLQTLADRKFGVLDIAGSLDLIPAGEAETPRTWDTNRPERIVRFVVTRDGKTLICARGLRRVEVYDVESQRLLNTVSVHERRISALALAPNQSRFVTGGWDGQVRVWDRATCQLLGKLDIAQTTGDDSEEPRRVLDVVFADDNRLLIADSAGFIHRWDLTGEHARWTTQAHADRILALAVSPDGRTFASASADRTAALWELERGERIAALIGHTEPVRTVTFSPTGQTQGKRILTGM